MDIRRITHLIIFLPIATITATATGLRKNIAIHILEPPRARNPINIAINKAGKFAHKKINMIIFSVDKLILNQVHLNLDFIIVVEPDFVVVEVLFVDDEVNLILRG